MYFPMQEQTIYQVDAFTGKLFAGNPAAVVPLDRWLPEETMQAIAMENNLSETAFFVPRGGGFQLRWFTPAVEVDLCGHATLASAHVLFNHLDFAGDRIEFHTRSGQLDVARSENGYVMNFPADQVAPAEVPPALIEGLNAAPLEVYQGREDYLVVFETQSNVAELQPDFSRLKALGGRGVIVTAPGYVVDFISRGFFPNAGVDEDPVTGSAHTTLTPYWTKRLDKKTMTARQISARGGELQCTLKGDRVELAGQAVTYLQGKIFLP